MMSASFLEKYTLNLNEKAKKSGIDPVIGRKTELHHITSVLLKKKKKNPLLLGDPGVGKTAIVEELARNIVDKTCHSDMMDKTILMLDTVGLIAGTHERGSLETKVTKMLKELEEQPDTILMIDEIHSIVSSDSSVRTNKNASSNSGVVDILKPALARGSIQCIGSTTYKEYSKFLSRDRAFERRFIPIYITEPNEEETIEILMNIKEYYESYHKCEITEDAVYACVYLSQRYLAYRTFPDKAIDLMDEACSKINMVKASPKVVQTIDVENVLQDIMKVPLFSFDEKVRIDNLQEQYSKKIVGQDHVKEAIVSTLRRYVCGFYSNNRPIASMLFLGPTGVGKTEMVNILAEEYFGSRDDLVRFDMSEYMEESSVSSLIGTPPGYVGFEDGGKLINIVKRKPYSVILLDEIEKAHSSIYDILLQIFEDGILRGGNGEKYSFKNNIIIMTSNIGFNLSGHTIGFDTVEEIHCTYNKNNIMQELKYTFRPELLNRIDNILLFDELSHDNIQRIVDKMIDEAIETIYNKYGLRVILLDNTRKSIKGLCYNTGYGARPIRNVITRKILDPVAEIILEGKKSMDKIIL